MELAKDDLIAALRMRYDHYSADTMFHGARERAGLADQRAYSPTEVVAFRAALSAIGDRLGVVDAKLDSLLGPTPASTKPAPEAAAPPVAEPKAKPKKAAPEPVTPTREDTTPVVPAAVVETTAAGTTVVLTGLEVDDDEAILMCGGSPELGDWEPEQARPMSREADRWTATVPVAPDAEIEFKFLRRAADGSQVWEGGPNRTLSGTEAVVAEWRQVRTPSA